MQLTAPWSFYNYTHSFARSVAVYNLKQCHAEGGLDENSETCPDGISGVATRLRALVILIHYGKLTVCRWSIAIDGGIGEGSKL